MPAAQPPRRPSAQPLPRPRGVPARAPLHPGRFLQRHYLAPLGISQTAAARLLGISRRRLNEILQGKRGMTPDTAIRCALAFRADVAFWLALQTSWDSFHAWRSLCASRVLRAAPVRPIAPFR